MAGGCYAHILISRVGGNGCIFRKRLGASRCGSGVDAFHIHGGTALGNATNRLAGRVAQQTSTSVPHQVITTVKPGAGGKSKVPVASTAPAPLSGNGSLIASIQGGERQAGCAPAAKTADAKGPAKAATQNNCAPAAQAKDDHPSVVNLPAAQ
jgi:hypothetical protein